MQRISSLLQKLSDLSTRNNEPELIDIDLMLDYTKVIYADLLELRSRIAFNNPVEMQHAAAKKATVESVTPNFPEIINEPEQGIIVSEPIIPTSSKNQFTSERNDIKTLIGVNDKYQYISELFGNDKKTYEHMINQINNFSTYEEAVTWLDAEVHSVNNWDDENEIVQSFYNTLSSFFASR